MPNNYAARKYKAMRQATARRYYQNHKDERNDQNRKWCAENLDRRRVYMRAYMREYRKRKSKDETGDQKED